MSNKTTYTINFKAQSEDVQKVLDLITKIQEKSNKGELKLTDANKKNLVELETSAKSLQAILSEKLDSESGLSQENLKMILDLFGKLTSKVGNFKKGILELVVPQELQSELNILTNKLEELKKKKEELSKQLNTKNNPDFAGYNIDKKTGQATVIKSFKDKETIKQAGQLEAVSGVQITKYDQLLKVIELLNKAQQDRNSLTNQEAQAYERIKGQVDNYRTALTNIDASYDEAVANIPNIIAKYQELVTEIERVKNEYDLTKASLNEKTDFALSAKEVSETSRETAQSLNAMHEEMSNDGTKAVEEAKKKQKEYNKELERTRQQTDKNKDSEEKHNKSLIDTSTSFGKAVDNVFSYGTALTFLRTIYNELISTITDMDEALTGMTVVTQLSREEAWNMVGTLQELAKTTGITTTEIANMTTMYLQQGKTINEALKLTEAAAKAARIAGISGAESINLLTNAMNGFQLEASQAMEVSDKFAALAAAAATDYEELATALSKVAAQANLAGMSMDFTLGLLTKGIEVTREAPETIGTALKTVISRMRELTDYGETLEDGVDVNRVDTALKNIGVSLLDNNREFRDLEEVLTEVGTKWETLNKNQQANVAVALAGTRQQSRLIAMMQDFDRTQQLVTISMNSAGATAGQHAKYMKGLEAATTNLTTSFQGLISTIVNSESIIWIINRLADILKVLEENIYIVWTAVIGLLITAIPGIFSSIGTAFGSLSVMLQNSSFALIKNTKKTNENTVASIVNAGAKEVEAKATDKLTKEKVEDTAATDENTTSKFANTVASLGWIAVILAAVVAVGALVVAIVKSTDASEKAKKRTAELQEQIYEYKQMKNTVQPLVDEYEELDKKVVKTAEDLERMKTIMEEIKNIKAFQNEDGSFNWDKYKKFVNGDEYDKEHEKHVIEGKNVAFNEFRRGNDKITDQLLDSVAEYYNMRIMSDGDLSDEEKINADYNITKAMALLEKDDWVRLTNKGLGEDLYKNFIGVTSENYTSKLAEFAKYVDNDETMLNTFKAVFAPFEQIEFLKNKNINMAGLNKFGITYDEVEEMKKVSGLSDDIFYKRLKEASQSEDKIDFLSEMYGEPEEINTKYLNSIEGVLVDSNQDINETLTKTLTANKRAQELADKIKKGTATAEDIRQAQAELDEETFIAITSGTYDFEKANEDAINKTIDDLEILLESARLSGDEALQKSINAQIDAIKYADYYASDYYKSIANITTEMAKQKRLQNEINDLMLELDREVDPNKRKNITQSMLDKYSTIRNNYSNILNNEYYKRLSEAGYIVDGEVIYSQEEYSKLLREQGEEDLLNWLNANYSLIKEAYDANKTFLEGFRTILEEEYNKQKELLEKQKEQYKEYWDRLDSIEEEQEREQSRENILNQLSALSGGSDAASNSLRKDLLGQLEDLNKEEAETRRQEMRDNLTKNIDKHVESIDEKIGALSGMSKEELSSEARKLGYSVPKFANGGLVNYTGPAWVDGTKSKPEAFLDSYDTKLIQELVDLLRIDSGSLTRSLLVDGGSSESFIIQTLNIVTNELNNEQDFRKSGQIFAEEFTKAIRERGINRNVKK